MEKFTYHSPTEVIFGRDSEKEVAKYVKKYGGRKVFIVYGGGSVLRSGLLDVVTGELAAAGIETLLFGGAQPNPAVEHAREGVKKALEFGADFILAVGGGSSIDTAKGIAHGVAAPDIDIWDFWTGKKPVERSMPIGVVLTISAAGSETSDSAVLTNKMTKTKLGLGSDLNRPKFAIMNPELTFSLPVYQVACGVTDIMMHTLDRYFNPIDNDLTDAIAEALLRTVIKQGRIAVANPHDYEAMSEVMWAGSLSHNGLTGLGGMGDWAVHELGHELSAKFDLAHGATLSTMWGAWARWVCNARIGRFAQYARNVWGVVELDDAVAARKGILATEEYFASLGMPICFSDGIGVQTDEMCKTLAFNTSFEGTRTIGSFMELKQADMLEIYRAANH